MWEPSATRTLSVHTAEGGNVLTIAGVKNRFVTVLALFVASAGITTAGTTEALAATLTVNRTSDAADADTGDGLCDSNIDSAGRQCTLRAAIEQANASDPLDVIGFNITGPGRHVIEPQAALPPITSPVNLDGYTESGATENTSSKGTNARLMIVLDGSQTPSGEALVLDGVSGSTIRGLVIKDFDDGGITIRNGGSDNLVAGNFIGTTANGKGVGSLQPHGVSLDDSDGNTIGGPTAAGRNLLSGTGSAVQIFSSDGNTVQQNLMGTDKSGKSYLGNGAGVDLPSGSNNLIRRNTIAFGSFGVFISGFDSLGNSILNNSIFNNEELGIWLASDSLDPRATYDSAFGEDDSDLGPNNYQNYAYVEQAHTTDGVTTVSGWIESGWEAEADEASDSYTVQLFANPPGTSEGKQLVASFTLVDDGTEMEPYEVQLSKTVPLGQKITATATDQESGDTSMFSPARMVRRS